MARDVVKATVQLLVAEEWVCAESFVVPKMVEMQLKKKRRLS